MLGRKTRSFRLGQRLVALLAAILILAGLHLKDPFDTSDHLTRLTAADQLMTLVAPPKSPAPKARTEDPRPAPAFLASGPILQPPVPRLLWSISAPRLSLARRAVAACHKDARAPPALPLDVIL